MEVITSHTNADFDALASMVAARKLYPEAKLVFPGSQEKSMRDFFLESAFYAMEVERLRNVDVGQVSRLIVVDNRNPARLGKLSDALKRPGISIHIYDHHPAAEGDLRGEVEVIEAVGATTTIMVELLQAKNLPIEPLEATIFALGIYEETGSLTYASTTERDARAAGLLISLGAQLNIVADFVSRELPREQLSLLRDLMGAATSYDINGVHVVIAAMATSTYVPDLANLAHKIRDRESLDVLFLVVQMGDKTHLIGRSRIGKVNVGLALSELGGGGHATAASAVAREMTYLQARERLIDILKHHIQPGPMVREIMTAPVKTIPAESTLEEAGGAMTRFSVNVLPVLQEGQYQGIITREIVQKALIHGLGRQKVGEFMTTGGPVASPEMLVGQVERIMIEEHQRFLPVMDHSGSLVGAVTRTDLLRSLHEERLSGARETDETDIRSVRNVKHLIEERLPAGVGRVLRAVGEVADASGFPVYLVGGIVRDLFLHVANLDIDIVVEGDGITFAGMLVAKMGGRMKTHLKFGTAVVVLPDGVKIDIATARLEYYASPAALPTVELSSIKKDLYRRDFTINTLAVRLNRKRFGELIDFFSGLRDIKDKTIRVLHSLSFVEDPTRVLRAIRFEQRFDFRLSKHTQNLIKSAVNLKLFHRLSGDRITSELQLLFSETDPARVLKRMSDFDLLKFIHPGLKASAETERLFGQIGEAFTWFRMLYLDGVRADKWFVYFLGLLDRLKDATADEILDRLSIPARTRERVRQAREKYRDVLYVFYKEQDLRPSALYHLLSPLDIEALLLMMAKAKQEEARKYISLYLTRLREVKVTLTGDDLKAIGIPPGPRYRRLLAELLDARLDGLVKTRDEEINFIKTRSKGTSPLTNR
ncbi:MAG TPA: CBS domain-containing protein [Nitrospirota bacterium]|nr:CBS domain-containing protein [Nitrospirota bacterium]